MQNLQGHKIGEVKEPRGVEPIVFMYWRLL